MDELAREPALIDLANLLSGLIGAVVGAFLVLAWQLLDRRHAERMAVRLVRYECINNSTILMAATEEGQIIGPLSQHAWQTQGTRLVARLPAEAMKAVTWAYFMLPHSQAIMDRGWQLLMAGDPGPHLDSDALRNLNRSREEFRAATAALEPHQ